MRWALGLTTIFLVAEVVGGVVTGSLALLSDAAHMFTDSAALAVVLAAIRIGKRPSDDRRTYGYKRFESLAAAFNALLLFVVAGYIFYEARGRLRQPAQLGSIGILVVAAIGLGVNLASVRLLSGGKNTSVNIKGAYLEVWSDLLGSVGVIVAALIIYTTGWQWVDSVVAVSIALWILPRTWLLLRETTNVLLEGVPDGLDLAAARITLLTAAGVRGVHDLHVWAITSGAPALTAHVVHDPREVPATTLLKALRQALADRHQIHHVTLQMEEHDCGQRHDLTVLAERGDPSNSDEPGGRDH